MRPIWIRILTEIFKFNLSISKPFDESSIAIQLYIFIYIQYTCIYIYNIYSIQLSCRCLICILFIYLLVLKSIILVQIRANNLHKVHCPLFCQAPSLKSANCPSPPFQAIPPYILFFFVTILPVDLHKISKFFIFNSHPIL